MKEIQRHWGNWPPPDSLSPEAAELGYQLQCSIRVLLSYEAALWLDERNKFLRRLDGESEAAPQEGGRCDRDT